MKDRSDDPETLGFPQLCPAPEPAPRRRASPAWIRAGVTAALALGLGAGFGMLILVDFDGPGTTERSQSLEAASVSLPIAMAAIQSPPAPPPATSPLEVLPPDMTRAAGSQPGRDVPWTSETAVAATGAPASARARESGLRRADPDFSCRRPDSQSERLVCGDAQLTRLDRGMNRAFNAALAAGAPYESLRLDQDDWLRIREDAARHEGPDGVASVYRRRIAELQDIAANF